MQAVYSSNLVPHLVAIDSISPDPANLRKHPERSIEAIKASLRRFGQQKPLVVDANGVVVAGNGTLEAARQLGWNKIAAVTSDLAGIDRTLFAIADNRSAELSEWDREALTSTLAQLDNGLAEMVGFSTDELEQLAIGTGGDIEEDDVPEPLPKAVTVRGDLWLLGEQRLLCGDSLNAGDVAHVMNGERANLVATDPPYLVNYTGERGRGGKDWSGLYKEIEIKDAEAFYRGLFTNILAVAAPKIALYVWHAHLHCGLIQQVWKSLGILDHQQIIWVKPFGVIGRMLWNFRHEPCIVGWIKGVKPLQDGEHKSTSVWEVEAPGVEDLTKLTKTQLIGLLQQASSAWEIDWEGKARVVANEHPTQKPVEIFARPMRKHTGPGAVVFEPFSGSGSQLIAAEQLKRRCRAIELEPVFVDVAVRRWQKLTGQPARLDSDGRTWEEIAAARSENPLCPPNQAVTVKPKIAKGSRSKAATAKPTPSHTDAKRGIRRKAQPTHAVTAPPGGS